MELQRSSELGENQIEWKALRTALGYEQSYLRVKEKGIVFGHQHVQLLVDKGYGERQMVQRRRNLLRIL